MKLNRHIKMNIANYFNCKDFGNAKSEIKIMVKTCFYAILSKKRTKCKPCLGMTPAKQRFF